MRLTAALLALGRDVAMGRAKDQAEITTLCTGPRRHAREDRRGRHDDMG